MPARVRIVAPSLAGLAAALVLLLGPVASQAGYPERVITLVAPFPAGGATDLSAGIVSAASSQRERGCRGQPLHCRAVVRLKPQHVARRRGPPERRGSSSRMPAIAAIDNETLDHLLSVVDDGGNVEGAH
jgi:hypothetical protein